MDESAGAPTARSPPPRGRRGLGLGLRPGGRPGFASSGQECHAGPSLPGSPDLDGLRRRARPLPRPPSARGLQRPTRPARADPGNRARRQPGPRGRDTRAPLLQGPAGVGARLRPRLLLPPKSYAGALGAGGPGARPGPAPRRPSRLWGVGLSFIAADAPAAHPPPLGSLCRSARRRTYAQHTQNNSSINFDRRLLQ